MLHQPHQPQAYSVLAQNLSRHLGQFREGLRVIQFGIIHNKNAEWVNELYAEAAYIYLFDVKRTSETLKVALKYVEKAIQTRPVSQEYSPCDLSCTLKNYLMMKSEIEKRLQKKKTKIVIGKTSLPISNIKKNLERSSSCPTIAKHHHDHNQNMMCRDSLHLYQVSLKEHLLYSFILMFFSVIVYFIIDSKGKRHLQTNI